jgi:hypothetical protein
MTDDLCGAETGAGGECQNPATEGDSCWIESHGGHAQTGAGGRPSTFTDDLARMAIAAAEKGKSERGIEREVGVGRDTIFSENGWIEQGHTFTDADGTTRKFSVAIERARARGEDEWIREGRGDDGDSSFAKFMLSTSYGYIKTEKREVDMDVDATHDVTADFVTYGADDDE